MATTKKTSQKIEDLNAKRRDLRVSLGSITIDTAKRTEEVEALYNTQYPELMAEHATLNAEAEAKVAEAQKEAQTLRAELVQQEQDFWSEKMKALAEVHASGMEALNKAQDGISKLDSDIRVEVSKAQM